MFQQRRWLSKSHISLFTGQNFVSSNISVLTYLILLWTDRQVITTSVMDHQECPGESRRRNLLLNRMEKRINSDGMCSVKMTNLWSSLKSTRWQSSHIKSVCGSKWTSCVLCYPQGHTEALWRDVFPLSFDALRKRFNQDWDPSRHQRYRQPKEPKRKQTSIFQFYIFLWPPSLKNTWSLRSLRLFF